MEKDRRRCSDDLRNACSDPVGDRPERLRAPLLQVYRFADFRVGGGHGATGKTDRVGPIGDISKPVRAVFRILFGRPVIDLVFKQDSDRAVRAARRNLSGAKLRVNFGDPPGHQAHREAVHGDVMISRVPKELFG